MKFYGLDVETAGERDPMFALQPWRVKDSAAHITALSVVSEDDETLFSQLEPSNQDLYDVMYRLSCIPAAVVIGWNTVFDAAWFVAYGLEDMMRRLKWADGFVYRRALENHANQSAAGEWGLKNSVALYLPEHAGYEEEIKQRTKDNAEGWSQVDSNLLDYNRYDSAFTARLGRLFWDRLDSRKRVLCSVIHSSIVPFASAWVRGLETDTDYLRTWREKVGQELDGHRADLDKLGVDVKTVKSHVKLKAFLNARGYNVPCVDRTELTKYKGDHLIDPILAFKKSNNALSKFIGGIEKSLEYNGHTTTHPAPRIWNTYTGRCGYTSKTKKKYQTGIAIHQWIRGKEARRFLVAPPGYLLAEWDFSTQESRLLADHSGDAVLLDIFRNNLDFHTYMAARIADSPYDHLVSAIASGDKDAKNFRQCAKVVNLSLTYRASWKRLIDMARKDYDLTFTEAEAQLYHRLYRETYQGVPDYWYSAVEIARMQGFAETRAGRTVLLDDWSRARSWASESTAINFPIQGTGADMKHLAIGVVDPILWQNGGHYLLDLHDALFALVPDNEDGRQLSLHVKAFLSHLPYEKVYGWKPKVPMPVDLKLGRAWGQLEEIK